MRISDWSSDVCSSDLELTKGGADYTFEAVGNIKLMEQALAAARIGWSVCTVVGVAPSGEKVGVLPFDLVMGRKHQGTAMGGVIGRATCRESVCQAMLISVVGGLFKKKQVKSGQ